MTAPKSKPPKDNRPYVRIDQGIWHNPKVLGTERPALAVGAHIMAITYCATSQTDGLFPLKAVCRMNDIDDAMAGAMVEQGLWHIPGHGCPRCPQPETGKAYVHDYLDWQRSVDEVQELSRKRSAAGKKANETRWGRGEQPPVDPSPPPDVTNGIPAGSDAINDVIANRIPNRIEERIPNRIPNAVRVGSVLNPREEKIREELTPPTPPPPKAGDRDPNPGGENLDQETEDLCADLVRDVVAVRPEWKPDQVAAVLSRASIARRPWPVVAYAAMLVAGDRETKHFGRLELNREWWDKAEAAMRPPLDTGPPLDPALIHDFEPDPVDTNPAEPVTCKHCHAIRDNRRHPKPALSIVAA